MQAAKWVTGIVLVLGAMVAIVLLVVLIAWNSVAGPWIGGASVFTLLGLFVVAVGLLVGGVLLIASGLEKKLNT